MEKRNSREMIAWRLLSEQGKENCEWKSGTSIAFLVITSPHHNYMILQNCEHATACRASIDVALASGPPSFTNALGMPSLIHQHFRSTLPGWGGSTRTDRKRMDRSRILASPCRCPLQACRHQQPHAAA